MGRTTQNVERPHFVIDPSADEAVRDRLLVMERRIHAHPDAYLNALTKLGEKATAGSIEYTQRDEREVTLKRGPKELLSEFFRQRLDVEMSFDDTTEDALMADPKHQELLEDVKSKHSERLQLGAMKSTQRPNEQAVPAREKLRKYRLEFYIGRVIASKSATSRLPKHKTLRSAG